MNPNIWLDAGVLGAAIPNDFLNTGAFGVGIVGLLLITRALSDGQKKVLENWQQVQADCRSAIAELTKRHGEEFAELTRRQSEEFGRLIDDHKRLQEKHYEVLTDNTRAIEGNQNALRSLQSEFSELSRTIDDLADRPARPRRSTPAIPTTPSAPAAAPET